MYLEDIWNIAIWDFKGQWKKEEKEEEKEKSLSISLRRALLGGGDLKIIVSQMSKNVFEFRVHTNR